MSRPSILVTGAPGWLGTCLLETILSGAFGARELLGGGHLRALRHPGATVESGGFSQLGEIEWVSGDLRSTDALASLCDGAAGSVLFHAAGVVHPSGGIRECYDVNAEGTRRLIDAAVSAGVTRIVAVSSNSPFGFNQSAEEFFDEASPYNPYMAYGRSKHLMELAVFEASHSGRIETVIVRPPWFYGPNQPRRQSTFFSMIRRGRFPVLGDGKQLRSMVYVENLCQGLLLAAGSAGANGEAYWIADLRPYSISEIVDTVKRVLIEELDQDVAERQIPLPGWIGELAGTLDGILQRFGYYNQQIHVLGEMGKSIACATTKARLDLGYAPRFSLEHGMRESVRWCLAQGISL